MASRALKQQAEPIVTMKLSLGGHGACCACASAVHRCHAAAAPQLTHVVCSSLAHLLSTSEPAVHALQTDPSTLQHMTSELEQALKEMRTPHYRRVTRGVRS